MGALRAAAFALAEGVRLYLGAARRTPGDFGGLRQQAQPVGVEFVGVVENGGG